MSMSTGPVAYSYVIPCYRATNELEVCYAAATSSLTWRRYFCIIVQPNVENQGSEVTLVSTNSMKAKNGSLSYHRVEQHWG